mgnify:CR=1 FL=1
MPVGQPELVHDGDVQRGRRDHRRGEARAAHPHVVDAFADRHARRRRARTQKHVLMPRATQPSATVHAWVTQRGSEQTVTLKTRISKFQYHCLHITVNDEFTQ